MICIKLQVKKNQINKFKNLKNKIALIGFGYWGKIYYKYLKKNNKMIVYTRSKIKDAANYQNCEFTNKISKILKDKNIKKVFVITPIDTHFQISKKFLNGNKKVLCEKPLILKQNEISLIEKKFKNQIFVSYPYTYSKIIKKVQNIIKKYQLGTPKFIYVNFSQAGRFNKNSVYQLLGPHVLSIISKFLNLENYLIVKKKTNLFSYKNETGIYEISKNKKIFAEIIISTNYLFDKKKEIIFFFENSNIIYDLTKNRENIVLRRYLRKKIKTYDYANVKYEKKFSIEDKDNIKLVIENFLNDKISFKNNMKLTKLINSNI